MPADERTAPPGATEAIFPTVYDELKRLAHRRLRAADGQASLCTTELVHEAFLKLAGPAGARWESRAHFFGAASRAMRQVLVDLARRHRAAKRGGGETAVTLGDVEAAFEMEIEELLELETALTRLEAVDPRLARVVELRFFAGVVEHDIARMLAVSCRTVERDWLKARLFLLSAMGPARTGPAPSRGGR